MASLDHIILKVNDLEAMRLVLRRRHGLSLEGMDGPFTVLKVGPECQLQLAPWGNLRVSNTTRFPCRSANSKTSLND